jgi:hypothetical protein
MPTLLNAILTPNNFKLKVIFCYRNFIFVNELTDNLFTFNDGHMQNLFRLAYQIQILE